MSDSLRTYGMQHARPPCPSPTPGVYPNSCPLSQWCHPTTSSSVIPFSLCPQSFPASGSFPVSQLFALGGQSIGASASASVLPMNIQGWFPLRLTGLISLLKQKKKKLSIKKNFETLENFRKVERILQWIPTYPSHMFTNVILPYLLYMYTSIYLFFPFIYLLNHLKVQRSCYRDYDILPLNMSPKS